MPYQWDEDILDFTAGANNICAVKTDGTVRCWGVSLTGYPPDGTFASIDAGLQHICGLLDGQNSQAAGTVRYWGWDAGGQATVPADLTSATFSNVSAGFLHTCGLLDGQNYQIAGQLRCWGISQVPTTNPYYRDYNFNQSTVPADLTDATFSTLATGDFHNCVILDGQNGQNGQAAGTVRC